MINSYSLRIFALRSCYSLVRNETRHLGQLGWRLGRGRLSASGAEGDLLGGSAEEKGAARSDEMKITFNKEHLFLIPLLPSRRIVRELSIYRVQLTKALFFKAAKFTFSAAIYSAFT